MKAYFIIYQHPNMLILVYGIHMGDSETELTFICAWL